MGSTFESEDRLSRENRFLERLNEVLEEQVKSDDLSIPTVSRRIGISNSSLYRKLKELTGSSPSEYIKKFQLQKAAALLASNVGNISEIAYETGFSNPSYFAKCFKKEYGVTPSTYVKRKRQDKYLPIQFTSFVGRIQELDEIEELIKKYRLINLTGPAGTGKTRLGLEVAKRVRDSFKEGVYIVHLASLDDPELVSSAILRELQIPESRAQESREILMDHLMDREVLLFLDNFEHLTEAGSDIHRLLQRCPNLKILITSRVSLQLSGEYRYPVSPLAVPDLTYSTEDSPKSLDRLRRYPSVQLFLERVKTIDGDFQLNKDNAEAVSKICRYLDGLPLALELAASQINLCSPADLEVRLRDSLSILKSGDIDRPKRHHTLNSAINWSYDLLTEQEKNLFQRLSLFPGSFDEEAAEAVLTSSVDKEDVLEGLRSLLDKNFLQTFEAQGKVRFWLLETLKVYGRNKLQEHRSEKQVVRDLARYYLDLAITAESQLKGKRQKYWIDRLGIELDNLRGVLSYLEENREVELGLRLSTSLWRYWGMQNMINEGRQWLRTMIDLANTLKYNEEHHSTLRMKGKALSALGILSLFLTEDLHRDAETFRQCVTIFRKLDEKEALAENLNHYGWVNAVIGNYNKGMRASREARELHKQTNDTRGIAVSYNNLGWIAYTRGNLARAHNYFSKSISLRDRIEDNRGSAFVSTYLALVERCMGTFEPALSRLTSAQKTLQELDDKQLLSMARTSRGYVLYDMGRYRKARSILEDAIEGWEEIGNRFGLYLSYDLLGLCLLELDKPEFAKKYIQSAHSGWSGIHIRWSIPFSLYCVADYEAYNGQNEKALSHHQRALKLRINQDEKVYICESLEACSKMSGKLGLYEPAVTHLAAASALRNRIKAPRPPRFQEAYDHFVLTCKKEIGADGFRNAWEKGENNSIEQVIDLLAQL